MAHKRPALDSLVDRVVVRRTGYREYDVAITWTPLGARLAAVAGETTGNSRAAAA